VRDGSHDLTVRGVQIGAAAPMIGEMADVPLLAPALIVLAIAALEWRGARPVALIAFTAAGVLLTAALAYPGLSAGQVLAAGSDAVAYPLAVARPAALACLLAFALRRVRHAN
jgi:hypothetical protein